MKNKVAYLDVDHVLIGYKYSVFNISFDIPYMGNPLVPMASSFTIDNLSQDTINYIATNTTLFQDRTRHIKFYAGYEDNVKMLFDGEIQTAEPSGQPDTSLEIKAWTSTKNMGTNISVEAKNTTYMKLIEDAADKCGLGCIFAPDLYKVSRLQDIVPYFSHTGSQQDYLRRVMMDTTGFNVVKDGLLFCIANQTLYVSQQDAINPIVPIKEISAETGLIGKPEPNAAGVNLRVLMDVTLGAGQTIRLKSKLMPLYNGLYNIYGLTHHGSTRGNDFYTDLICIRVYRDPEGSVIQGEYGVIR